MVQKQKQRHRIRKKSCLTILRCFISTERTRRVAVRHDEAGMEAELNTMVDNGCTVVDVIVEHPLYGQLTGPLQISNRYEVSQFIERCKKAEPLSSLTDGIHLHTLSCPDEAAFERTKSALRALRVLLEENGN